MRFFASATLAFSVLSISTVWAKGTPVLADLALLKTLGLPVIAQDESIQVGYAVLSEVEKSRVLFANHSRGKCGGFEQLDPEVRMTSAEDVLRKLSARVALEKARLVGRKLIIEKKAGIEKALGELKEENLRATVQWLSNYPDRYNKAENPNVHVDALVARLNEIIKASQYHGDYSIQTIDHSSTRQKSVRVRLTGGQRPSEIVVIGGHLDSINGWGGPGRKAPGADDNASGSANVLEALRVLVSRGMPERTIEFFWYAGEESGLLGSAEIAKQYKKENRDVVAVLQLDMTLFPGAGEFVIGNVTDFTSKWLQDYLVAINDLYIKAKLIEDQCGYGCSDHASWFRQGYPTLLPFEADTTTMNQEIHTEGDRINEHSNFHHSLQFSQIALVFAMDLGNSTARQP